MSKRTPDLSQLDDVVADKVLRAMRVASAQLTTLGVRHALVGGLAVGAYGYPRGTSDVDFLVGDEAFEQHAGGIVTMKPGLPIQVAGVAIDFLSVQASEGHLVAAFTPGTAEPPVAPIGPLLYLKLKSPRQKDRADVVELIKAGIDVALVRDYLRQNAPDLLARFDEDVSTAERES
jgi:hypothetical protein